MTPLVRYTAGVTACALAIALGANMAEANADIEVGEAASVATNVEGEVDGTLRAIAQGDRVFQDQVITTDATGIAQIRFRDETMLAIGPGSTVTLDTFVYDPSGSAAKVALGLARGSFRFITGNSGSDVYEIATPSATIGVRGTAFDVYATESGEIAIAMIEGEVIVCATGGSCRNHSIVGKFLHMTRPGVFRLLDQWDDSIIPGVPFATAFPFLAHQGALLDTMRASTEVIGHYVAKAGETILEAGAAVAESLKAATKPRAPKIRLPKIRLPKLFK